MGRCFEAARGDRLGARGRPGERVADDYRVVPEAPAGAGLTCLPCRLWWPRAEDPAGAMHNFHRSPCSAGMCEVVPAYEALPTTPSRHPRVGGRTARRPDNLAAIRPGMP